MKPQKLNRKLTLNRETIRTLNDDHLQNVAGGLLGTKGGHCRDQTFEPACPSGQPECIYLSRLFTCGCPPTLVFCP